MRLTHHFSIASTKHIGNGNGDSNSYTNTNTGTNIDTTSRIKAIQRVSLVLVSIFLLSIPASTAFATELDDGSATVPGYLTATATALDVTVTDKATFDLPTIDTNDATVSSINIQNNLDAVPIIVSNIKATASEGFTINPFDTDFKSLDADSNNFGIAYTGTDDITSKTQDLNARGYNLVQEVAAATSKNFNFKGKSTVYSQAKTIDDNINIANIIFTIGMKTATSSCSSEELSKWNYTINDTDKTVTLNYYQGTLSGDSYVADENVTVCGAYLSNDEVYRTIISSNTSDAKNTTPYMFNVGPTYGATIASQNKNIKTITFDEAIDFGEVTNMRYMFSGLSSLTSVNTANWDTSNVTDMSSMFESASALTTVDVSDWDTGNVTDMSSMFYSASALTSLDVSNWDTGNVTDMGGMFLGAYALTSLDVSNWDTSNVTNMEFMFQLASSLTSLDVSNWDTSKVTNMRAMFAVGESYNGNGQLAELIGLGNWDVSNVTDMTCMFYGAGQMTSYDIAGWDVSNVESLNHMFADNFKLESLDLSGWDTSSVKTMYDMFDDARALTTIGDVSHWNTTNLIDVGGLLNGASSFVGNNGTLDLSGWDTTNLKVAGEMFRATKLSTIDLSSWTFDSITNDKWSGAGRGIYYETGNDDSNYKGLGCMFQGMPNLTTVYLSQAGKDSYDAAVTRGVNITNMWNGSSISDFTIKGTGNQELQK